jgi:DNA-binding transcriptional MerR regulator
VSARLAIGDFSRMTHLSVIALRHYHEVGLLTGPIREQYLVTQFDTDDESGLRTEVCWPVRPGGT